MPRNAVLSVGYLWDFFRDADLWDFCGAHRRSRAASRGSNRRTLASHDVYGAGRQLISGCQPCSAWDPDDSRVSGSTPGRRRRAFSAGFLSDAGDIRQLSGEARINCGCAVPALFARLKATRGQWTPRVSVRRVQEASSARGTTVVSAQFGRRGRNC